jgi:glycosyltransferase involved in cell wall biosynthesis
MPNCLTLAALPARRRGVPVILDQHDTFPELFATKFGLPESHPLVRLIYREERWSAALADAMITVTDEARVRLADRGIDAAINQVVMNSPDDGVFGPARPPDSLPSEGPLRVIYHGGTAPRFGVESLIEAVGLLEREAPRLRLEVYGAFEDNGLIQRLAEELAPQHIRVSDRPTPFREIPEKLAAAHIGVVPTLLDPFTELLLPVKLLEYIHMGLPVVCSRLPVIERYFSDEELCFYQPGSSQGLAEALVEVSCDPAGARQRAVRAARRLQDLTWSVQRERYLGLIDALAGRTTRVVAIPGRNGNGHTRGGSRAHSNGIAVPQANGNGNGNGNANGNGDGGQRGRVAAHSNGHGNGGSPQ